MSQLFLKCFVYFSNKFTRFLEENDLFLWWHFLNWMKNDFSALESPLEHVETIFQIWDLTTEKRQMKERNIKTFSCFNLNLTVDWWSLGFAMFITRCLCSVVFAIGNFFWKEIKFVFASWWLQAMRDLAISFVNLYLAIMIK